MMTDNQTRIVVGATGRPRLILGATLDLSAVTGIVPRTYLWQLWRGRNWPATAAEEVVFAEELAEAAAAAAKPKRGKAVHDRADSTAVLNALRCGLQAAQLLEYAPGLHPARLFAAYIQLEDARARSVTAFKTIAVERDLEALVNFNAAASIIMNVPIRQMSPPSSKSMDAASLTARIARVVAQVEQIVAEAQEIEARLSRITPPSPVGVELGRQLYDPYQPGLWSHPFYLPSRVGDLVPVRVSDLLGERRM